MKRITAVLLMCIFSISFASCKDNAQSSSNEPGTSINTEDKSNEDIKGDEENMNTKITMTANGYSFYDYNGLSLGDAISRSLETFYVDYKAHRQLIRNAMKLDRSWKKSTEEYVKVYRKAMKK